MPEECQPQRVRNACEACHERKIKCKSTAAGGPCQTCAATGRHCYYLPRIKAGRPRRKRSPPPAQQNETASYDSPTQSNATDDLSSPDEPMSVKDGDMSDAVPSWSHMNAMSTLSDLGILDSGLSSMQGLSGFNQAFSFSGDEDMDQAFASIDVPSLVSDSSSAGTSPGSVLDAAGRTQSISLSPSIEGAAQSEMGSLSFFPMQQDFKLRKGLPDPAQGGLRAKGDMPTFRDLLIKSSEIQRLLELLQECKDTSVTFDTSSSSSTIQAVITALDIAGDKVMVVANTLTVTAASPASTPSATTGRPFGVLDSINPAVLTKASFEQSTNGVSWADAAIVAQTLALSLQILDMCDLLMTLRPADPQSHHHVLFLKRIDINIMQIRGALAQINRYKTLFEPSLSQMTLNRAAEVQSRNKIIIESAECVNYW